jgi:hypothetical protein
LGIVVIEERFHHELQPPFQIFELRVGSISHSSSNPRTWSISVRAASIGGPTHTPASTSRTSTLTFDWIFLDVKLSLHYDLCRVSPSGSEARE